MFIEGGTCQPTFEIEPPVLHTCSNMGSGSTNKLFIDPDQLNMIDMSYVIFPTGPKCNCLTSAVLNNVSMSLHY